MEKLIGYNKAKDKKEAYLIVKKNLTKNYLSQLKIDFKLEYFPKKNQIKASGSGFELNVFFEDDHVIYSLDLSLIYRPFKNKIVELLKGQLKQVI